jgi:hypothetical protein
MKILIKSIGFIGDNLFASSVIKKLKEQHPDAIIDFLCTKSQPFELISNNPYINNVYLENPNNVYDVIYDLKPIHRRITPCEQFQLQCDIQNPTSDYKIYTNNSLDAYVNHNFKDFKNKKIIAWLSNWEERSFLFNEEEYKRGIDIPNLGYGGQHRNIPFIIEQLESNKDIILIEIGKPSGYNETDLYSVSEYSLTASILKNCDYFIGAEGGLANLAAGVGTKTIITGDFIHQLYGWNGVIEKCEEPKLGPKYYFNDNFHITLDPYLTDKEVVNNINNIINGI